MLTTAKKKKTLKNWLFGALAVSGVLTGIACTTAPKAKEEKLCTAGNYVFCRCRDRQEGSKLCKEDSQSFGPCEPCESAENPEVPLEPGEEPYPVDPPPRRDGGSGDDDGGQSGTAKCGDNVVQEGEDCDDKNTNETDGCDKTCKLAGTAPPASNACNGLKVHVWGGTHKPSLVATTTGSGNRSAQPVCPNSAGSTQPSGSTAPDRVFEVIAHKSGMMTVAVTETNYNAFIYASDACPTDKVTWFACSNAVDGIGNEAISFPVDTGKSYFVFVDGTLPGNSNPSLLSGNFRVTFSIP